MDKLKVSESLDMHYLLSLMPPLEDEPEFAWLPELFSIIGYKALINLCKYAGGESIRIPTLTQLANDVEALQWFYDIYITKTSTEEEVPDNLIALVSKIKEIYDVRDNQK